jgi:hypothetical protein
MDIFTIGYEGETIEQWIERNLMRNNKKISTQY